MNELTLHITEQGVCPISDDLYIHYLVHDEQTGEEKPFMVRKVVDFGQVINPLYPIVEGMKGGVVNEKYDPFVWQTFVEKEMKWETVRPLTSFEQRAYLLLKGHLHVFRTKA